MTFRRPLVIDDGRVKEFPGGDQLDPAILNPVTHTVIPPGVVVAESISLSLVRSAKWTVTFSDVANGKFRCSEVLALQDTGGQVHFTQYAVIGDRSLPAHVAVKGVSGNMILEVTNSGMNDIVFDSVRTVTIPI